MGEVEKCCLVPYADMMNHKTPIQCSWVYDNAKKGMTVYANEDIKAGSQINIAYRAPHSNYYSFMNYGFVLQEYDGYAIPITL